MTTGNNTDYITQYISLRPSEDVRSIAELIEVENTDGYSGMNDDEIANLIAYKEYQAQHSEAIRIMQEESDARLKATLESLELQRAEQKATLNKLIENTPVFATVTDDGSEYVG